MLILPDLSATTPTPRKRTRGTERRYDETKEAGLLSALRANFVRNTRFLVAAASDAAAAVAASAELACARTADTTGMFVDKMPCM
jgi:hypothetical protein